MPLHHEPCRHHPQPLDPPLVRAGHCSQGAIPLPQHRSDLLQEHLSWQGGQACAIWRSVVGACPTGPAACLPVVVLWPLYGNAAIALCALHGLHLCGRLQVGGVPTSAREAAGSVPAGLQGCSDMVSLLSAGGYPAASMADCLAVDLALHLMHRSCEWEDGRPTLAD